MTLHTINPVELDPPAWDYGLAYVTQEAQDWLGISLNEDGTPNIPDTIAAGKADGRIPADAIDYRTGNAGGAFASYDAWMAAQLAQDKPGCFDIDLAPATMTFSYIPRGWYASKVSGRMARITAPSRTAGCKVAGYKYDVTFRFIDFINFGAFIKTSRRVTPQTINGTIQAAPYHYTSSGPYVSGQASAASQMLRVGALLGVSGAGNVTNIWIKRWVTNGTPSWSAQWSIRNPLFEGYPNYPKLINGTVTGATATSLAAAINAYTATSGFTAEVEGDNVLLFTTGLSKEPQWLEIECTGEMGHEECGVGLDISCCKFTDCDTFHYMVADSTAMGKLRVFHNVCVGTWGLVFLYNLRRTYVRCCGNSWSDCKSTRTPAAGRTSSRMPAGSNTSHYNTFFYAGTNSYLMSVFNATDEIYKNNHGFDIESLNNTDTNNCAVMFDLRDNSTDCRIENLNAEIGQFIFDGNVFENIVGLNGAEDCNAFYGKIRGGRFTRNKWKNTGAAWKSSATTENGSECGGLLIKEAAANYGMPLLLVEGNIFEDMPQGICAVKLDYQYNIIFRYNHFKNWTNTKDGINTVTDPASGGLVRITNDIGRAHVHSNYFENINSRGQPLILSFHAITPRGTLADNDVEISNNIYKNDGTATYPAYTGDATVMRFQVANNPFADPATFWNVQAKTGYSKTLSAAGADVGIVPVRYSTSGAGTLYPGTVNATLKPFADYDPYETP